MTGLLGGWIAGALLDLGAEVVALVRDDVAYSYFQGMGYDRRSTVVRGTAEDLLLNERIIVEYGVDAVFHLAAQSQVIAAREAPYHALESNVRGTYTVLEAVRAVGSSVRSVVVASSDKAYGEQPRLPYVESMPLMGANPYDASKAAADILARAYAHSYGLPVVVARCGNLFGGGDLNWARLVPGTIRSVLHGERPVVRSDGTMVRDYLYVRDAAEGFIAAAERADQLNGDAFNFSLERPLTVLQMIEVLGEVMGARLEPEIRDEARGEIPRQFLSSEHARMVLGWRPRVGLEDGLRETVEWYRAHLSGRPD